MRLSLEQQQLLLDLVEADRRLGRREPFMTISPVHLPGMQIVHDGWLDVERDVFFGDLEELAHGGLIRLTTVARGTHSFYITNRGNDAYAQLMRSRGSPVERTEQAVRRYLDAAEFAARHPAAYGKWVDAEGLLWADASPRSFTAIGHFAREAMQEFATSLFEAVGVPPVNADAAKTVARVRACLDAVALRLGSTERPFLDALLAYWGTVSDLVQRQEHGAQKEGQALQWRDARRVVFQCAVVMFEIDEAVAVAGKSIG